MEAKRPFFQPWMILLVMPLLGIVAMVLVLSSGDNATTPTEQVSAATPRPQTLPPRTPPPAPTSALGLPAPSVVLTDLNGETFTLADYQGRVIVLNFWATWCLPCEEEMPALQAYSESQGSDGAVVIAVTDPDSGQTLDDVRAFAERYGLTLRVAIDSGRILHYAYGVYGLPTTYFIDPQGLTHHYRAGQMDIDDIAGEVAIVFES